MWFLYLFNRNDFLCTVLIGFVAIIGDCLVSLSNLHIYKALFDNSTHSIIGGLTWLIITFRIKNNSLWLRTGEIVLCAFIASIIDLDHFIVARSWRLKDAANIQGRPPLHCTTVPVILTIVFLIFSKICASENLYHLAWIIFAAFFSHHIRDATRRGLWFYKIGSTDPIPYYLYVLLTMIMPYVIAFAMNHFNIRSNVISDRNVMYNVYKV